MEDKDTQGQSLEADSLENAAPGDQVVAAPQDQNTGGVVAPGTTTPVATKKKAGLVFNLRSLARRFNIYLLIFILLVTAAIAIAVILYFNSRASDKTTTVQTQTLSNDTLKQLANSDVSVGDAKQVLNVQSNAVFAGSVLVRQAAEVAGDLTVSGKLAIGALTVTGIGTFDQVQANSFQIAKDATVQGSLSIQKALSVTGSESVSGTLTATTIATNNLQLNGPLTISQHLATSGSTPNHTSGNALGSGGTASMSGNDTSGSVSVNVGSSAAAGCFMAITFSQAFSATPHVFVTPVGQAAGGIAYYVTRNSTGFSICTSAAVAAGSSFSFDYFVVG